MRRSEEIFNAFFGIPKPQLDADIAAAKAAPSGVLGKLQRKRHGWAAACFSQPSDVAKGLHSRLLFGHAILAAGRRFETAAFAIVWTAQEFAEHASDLASISGEIAALWKETGEIEERHGVDSFLIGEGPPDWEKA